jgi:small subunit ribosomal protein S16
MLKIKLTRLGKKKEPRYRIVVNEARDKRDGSYIAKLGVYQPSEKPKVLTLDMEAYDQWLVKGAQPTATVAFLAEVVRSGKGFPVKKKSLNKKAQAKLAARKQASEEKVAEPAPAESEPAAETPKAEEKVTSESEK